MPSPSHEFTHIARFEPETFGEPGHRTFSINAESESSTAKIWLEKEQLAELSLAILELAKDTPELGQNPGSGPMHLEASPLTHLDFKTNQLAFGHNAEQDLFIVDAYDPDDINSNEPTVRMWINRKVIQGFADKALKIVAAGRPICPLCTKPIDPAGHYCPRTNGHSKPKTMI